MKEGIVILQRILPHYRIGFFKKFYSKFPKTKILYGQPQNDEFLKNPGKFDSKNFIYSKNFYLNKDNKIFLSNIYLKIFKYHPKIIISVFNIGNLNLYFLLLFKFLLKYKFVLWSFGYDPFVGFKPKERFVDRMRLYFCQKADAVIFYWENGLKEISNYSKKTNHYFVAPNTLDTEILFQYKEIFERIGKEEIKKILGIKEKFHFIYVGRLLKDKQIDLLLKSFSMIDSNIWNCSLSVIGNGPEYSYLKKLSDDLKLNNVKFLGEILDEEITGKWIYISDAFVMPGRLGLSVIHSFCYGTPVISQQKKRFYHGEGIGYIKDGINGFLVKDGNINELAEKMIAVISNSELSNNLSLNAFETAKKKCSIENMLYGFEKVLRYLNYK